MTKLGNMPVPVVLTRDQINMLRFAMRLGDTSPPLWWDYAASRELFTALDNAHANAWSEYGTYSEDHTCNDYCAHPDCLNG